MQDKVIINCESIKNGEIKLLEKVDDIMKTLMETDKIVSESKECFDTPTATYFREKINEYILNTEKKMNSDVIKYIKSLDDIIKIYNETNDEINKKVK